MSFNKFCRPEPGAIGGLAARFPLEQRQVQAKTVVLGYGYIRPYAFDMFLIVLDI